MKKLLSLAPTQVFIACGVGLLMTLGAFWHHQINQTQIDRLNVLGQGIGTCFNRVSQTFTATMIKDLQSPYLSQSFMALSDECLNETIKGINPFKQNVGRGYESLNRLISETSWFHERVLKITVPMAAGKPASDSLALSEKFSKMEGLRNDLVDIVDSSIVQLKSIQLNDEILMGSGLIIFVLALSLLSLQEYNRISLRRSIERDALNLLQTNQHNVGALMDQLMDRALMAAELPVTQRIFKDYHGEILEKSADKIVEEKLPETKTQVRPAPKTTDIYADDEGSETPVSAHRSSLREVLVSLQNLHGKESMQITEVRDVQLNVEQEALEQMLNSAISKLESYGLKKRLLVSNQIHSDRAIINFYLPQGMFSATELESASGQASSNTDMNLLILKEMASENNVQWHFENKTDRHGKISGASIRLTLPRVSKESRAKNLISVVKGKKRDLNRELMN